MSEKREEAIEILKAIISNPSVTIEDNEYRQQPGKFSIGLHRDPKHIEEKEGHVFISIKELLKDIENQL